MCINAVDKKTFEKWLEKQPEVITMWKVLTKDLESPVAGKRSWIPVKNPYQYKYGENIAKSKGKKIDGKGFHVFLSRQKARNYREIGEIVRKALVNKQDVLAKGNYCYNRDAVVKKLVLLTPKEGR